jgi:hypothetical protein
VLAVCGLLVASVTGLFASPVPSGKPSAYPAWWFERDVIVRTNSGNNSPSWPSSYPASDDYAALNQGQLKNLASKAYAELQAKLPASVWSTTEGTALTSMVIGWGSSTTADDYAAANQGQLKTVAQKFYDVLVLPPAGYVAGLGLPPAGWTSGAYPWTSATTDDDSYAAANLGQAKYLFSFNLDTDEDGLPDWWEWEVIAADGGDALEDLGDVSPTGDGDGDGLNNLGEYAAGTNAVLWDTDDDGLWDGEDSHPLDPDLPSGPGAPAIFLKSPWKAGS